jgi:hypothetical protein
MVDLQQKKRRRGHSGPKSGKFSLTSTGFYYFCNFHRSESVRNWRFGKKAGGASFQGKVTGIFSCAAVWRIKLPHPTRRGPPKKIKNFSPE